MILVPGWNILMVGVPCTWYTSQDWSAQFIAPNLTVGDQAGNKGSRKYFIRINDLKYWQLILYKKVQISGSVHTNDCKTEQPRVCLSYKACVCLYQTSLSPAQNIAFSCFYFVNNLRVFIQGDEPIVEGIFCRKWCGSYRQE